MFQTEQLQEKWAPLLEYEGLDEIKDPHRKAVTAVLLENQEKFLREEQAILRKEQAEKRKRFLEEIKLEKKIDSFRKRELEEIKNLEDKFIDVFSSIKELENEQRTKSQQLRDMLLQIPNMPHKSVPIGESPIDNVISKECSSKKELKFKPKSHVDIVKDLDLSLIHI